MVKEYDSNDDIDISNKTITIIVVCIILGLCLLYGFYRFNVSSNKIKQDITEQRYGRAMILVDVRSFYPRSVPLSNVRWGINDNMTLAEARNTYYAYSAWGKPIAEGLLTWVCDGGSTPSLLDAGVK